jgi:GNAT superfamily N-acetyltransferase
MTTGDRPDIIFIRPAGPGDSAAIFDVFTESVTGLCPGDYPTEQVKALLSNKRPNRHNIRAWGDVVFVATLNAEVIGFSALTWDTICAAYVRPQQCRRGVGRALIEVLEANARSRHLSRILVTASLTGEPLYKACGYQIVQSVLVPVNGVQLPCVKLEKSLRSPQDYADPFTTLWRAVRWFLTGG